MYKLKLSLICSIFLFSCSQNIVPVNNSVPLNTIKANNNSIKGKVNISFNSLLHKNNNFTVKDFDLNNPEIKKIKIEVVGKDMETVSDEKNYVSGQNINFQLFVPIGKNRVISLYTIDQSGNILSQIMGVLDVKLGENTASISYVDTVIAQVFYSIILNKNDLFQIFGNTSSSGGSAGGQERLIYTIGDPIPESQFTNFNLNNENSALLDKLNIADVRKYIYDYTGYIPEQNRYNKLNPLYFNTVGLAKYLVKNSFLKRELFSNINNEDLSGPAIAYANTSSLNFPVTDKLKFNFSDLISKSGFYNADDLSKLGKFAMPGVWNLSISKPGYITQNKVYTIDSRCCGYYIYLNSLKIDVNKSYHSNLYSSDDISQTSILGEAKLLLNQDEQSGKIYLNQFAFNSTHNIDANVVNENGTVLFNFPKQNEEYILNGYPINISSEFLQQLKAGKLSVKLTDNDINKEIKGKISPDNIKDIFVSLSDSFNINERINNVKITVKSLETGKNFIASGITDSNGITIKDVPVGKIQITAEKEGYITKVQDFDINESGTSFNLVTYRADNSAPSGTIAFNYNNGLITHPGDIGSLRPVLQTDKDNNINFVPNINSSPAISITNTGYDDFNIVFVFNKQINRQSFEDNIRILSEANTRFNNKEIIRGTSSDDAGFTTAFTIDKNTPGASFTWTNDDHRVVFMFKNRLFWLNTDNEIKYKLTFEKPFEDISGEKAISATANNTSLSGEVISDKGGYLKYGDNSFADYFTFSVKKDYENYSNINPGISYVYNNLDLDQLILRLNKGLSLFDKNLVVKKDLNGNDINQSLFFDQSSGILKFTAIDGKIQPLAKITRIKSGKTTEEPLGDERTLIPCDIDLSQITLKFNHAYEKGDKVIIRPIYMALDGTKSYPDYSLSLNVDY